MAIFGVHSARHLSDSGNCSVRRSRPHLSRSRLDNRAFRRDGTWFGLTQANEPPPAIKILDNNRSVVAQLIIRQNRQYGSGQRHSFGSHRIKSREPLKTVRPPEPVRESPDNIASPPHLREHTIPAVSHTPSVLSRRLDQAELPQVCQPLKPEAAFKPLRLTRSGAGNIQEPIFNIVQHRPVDRGQPVPPNLRMPGSCNLEIAPWPQPLSDEVRRALAEAGFQIAWRDDEVLAPRIFSTHHNMGVRMPGIVVIDGDPVEACAEIAFHLHHQRPRRLPQVAKRHPVFR